MIAGEWLGASGNFLDENLAEFLRRLETITGWPSGSLKGKAFVQPRDAVAYIKKNRVAFAILPVHQFVEARKDLSLSPIGRMVGIEGVQHNFWGVARKDGRPKGDLHEELGLRLVMTEVYDLQWIRVLFEAELDPYKHFQLISAPDGMTAVDVVMSGRADMAMIREGDFQLVKPRTGKAGDLRWVYTSGGMPPPPFVVVGKFASIEDRKTLETNLYKLCRDGGGVACGHVGIVYAEPGKADTYNNIIKKYETYR